MNTFAGKVVIVTGASSGLGAAAALKFAQEGANVVVAARRIDKSQAVIRKGQYVPGNMYFTTTRLHQELAGAQFVDVIVDTAHDPTSRDPFKGNVDLGKLEALIARVGAANVPYVSIATTVNMAGGQPISLANLRQVRQLTQRHGIPIIHDATRVAENAYLIKVRETAVAGVTATAIATAKEERRCCSQSARNSANSTRAASTARPRTSWGKSSLISPS